MVVSERVVSIEMVVVVEGSVEAVMVGSGS